MPSSAAFVTQLPQLGNHATLARLGCSARRGLRERPEGAKEGAGKSLGNGAGKGAGKPSQRF